MNISGGYESKRGRTLLRHAVGFLDPQSNRRTFQGNLSLGGEKKKKKDEDILCEVKDQQSFITRTITWG